MQEGASEVTLCGLLALIQDDQMEVLYAGTHSEYLTYRAPYLTHWKLFEKAQRWEFAVVIWVELKALWMMGLSVFKGNFPVQIEEMIGEFEIAVMPVLSLLTNQGITWLKAVRRWKVKKC